MGARPASLGTVTHRDNPVDFRPRGGQGVQTSSGLLRRRPFHGAGPNFAPQRRETSTRDSVQTASARSVRNRLRHAELHASSTIKGTMAEESQKRIQRPALRSSSNAAITPLPRTAGPGWRMVSGNGPRPRRTRPARSSSCNPSASPSPGAPPPAGTNSATGTPRT